MHTEEVKSSSKTKAYTIYIRGVYCAYLYVTSRFLHLLQPRLRHRVFTFLLLHIREQGEVNVSTQIHTERQRIEIKKSDEDDEQKLLLRFSIEVTYVCVKFCETSTTISTKNKVYYSIVKIIIINIIQSIVEIKNRIYAL